MENRTYRYFTGSPLYPFGYGLSYTSFILNDARSDDQGVTVDVTNTGERDGATVIQVYVACDSPYAPIHPRLCGFRRISLKAGETQPVSVDLDRLTATVVNDEGDRIPAEHYTLYIGLSQPDEKSVSMTGVQPLIIRK